MTVAAPLQRRRAVVAGIWALTTAGGIVLLLAALAPSSAGIDSSFTLVMALAADGVIYASVGAFLAIRRPGSLVASVLMAGGALIIVAFNGFAFGAGLTLANGPDDPAAGLASLVGGLALYPALVVAGPALALVFPDGRLPGPRWRWAILVIACMLTAGFLLAAVRPGLVAEGLAINPLGFNGDAWTQWGELGVTVSGLALAASFVLGIIAVAVRYRRGGGIQRAQVRWFLAANVASVTFLSLSFLDGGTGPPTLFDILGVLSLALPPLAVGIAVMRYRLYEIDRIISRTIAYGAVTAILVGIYAGAIIVLQGPLGAVLGGDTISVALSTLVVAALFQPIRRRVQRAVDQRFDRARFDAERTVHAFTEQLRDEVDLSRLQRALVATADDAVRPVAASVWIRANVKVVR